MTVGKGIEVTYGSVPQLPRARGLAAYIRDGYGVFLQHKFDYGSCGMLVFRVCGVSTTFMCSVFTVTLTKITVFFIVK